MRRTAKIIIAVSGAKVLEFSVDADADADKGSVISSVENKANSDDKPTARIKAISRPVGRLLANAKYLTNMLNKISEITIFFSIDKMMTTVKSVGKINQASRCACCW